MKINGLVNNHAPTLKQGPSQWRTGKNKKALRNICLQDGTAAQWKEETVLPAQNRPECRVVYLCLLRSAVRADFQSNHRNLHGIKSDNILVTIIGLAFVSRSMRGSLA